MHSYHECTASPVAQMVKNPPQCGRPEFNPWVRKIPWRREWLPPPGFWFGESHGQRNLRLQSTGPQRLGHDSTTNTQPRCVSDSISLHLQQHYVSHYFIFFSNSDQCKVVSHCGFNSYSRWLTMLNIFSSAYLPSVSPLQYLFPPFLNWNV